MEGLTTIQKIIKKIINNPEEKKYRKIKRNSNYIKKKFKGREIEILLEIGFKEDEHREHGDIMKLETGYDMKILKYVEGCIAQAVQRKEKLNCESLINQIRKYKSKEIKESEEEGFVQIITTPSNKQKEKTTWEKTQKMNMSSGKRDAYKKEFEEHKNNERITGETGYQLLKKSKLGSKILADIWTRCDRGDKGYLEEIEFIMALFLIDAKHKHKKIPTEEEMRELFEKYTKKEEEEEVQTKKEPTNALTYTKLQLDNMENDVTCPICFDIFENPYKLPCNHSYCKGCLDELIEYQKSDQISCPKCKRESHKSSMEHDHDMVKMVSRVTDILNEVNHLDELQGKQMITYSSLGNSQGNYTEIKRSTSNISLELVNDPETTQPPVMTYTKQIDYIPYTQIFILIQADSLSPGTPNVNYIQQQTKSVIVVEKPSTTDSEECLITIRSSDQQQLHMAEAMIFDCISTFNSGKKENTHTFDVYRRMIDDVPTCYHEDLNKKGRQHLDQIEQTTNTKIRFIPSMGTLEISGTSEIAVADAGRMIHIIYENMEANLEKSQMHGSMPVPHHQHRQQQHMQHSMMAQPLPDHIEIKLDPNTNRHYYVDHLHEFTTWYHPDSQKYKDQLKKHLENRQRHVPTHQRRPASMSRTQYTPSTTTRHQQQPNECAIM